MKLSHLLSRTQSNDSMVSRRHVPWTASPLDKRAMASSGREGLPEESKTNVNERVLQFDEGHGRPQLDNTPVFKPHRESSTIELFYDLFFVANLTVFTKNHEINSGKALTSYVGFFTLLWFTWLQTALFDVRFSTDSVINRVFKAVSFGVMTGFAVVSSQYSPELIADETLINTTTSFRALALILMVSRLALVLQYGVVFWYVKGYAKTKVPLTSTMAILFITSMIFLGTYFGFPINDQYPNGVNHHVYLGWYAVVVFEALALIVVSCVWRVVSFRHTHLVERIGLLTLIIMGEGIIGLATSVSTILQNSVQVSSATIGTIVAGILLIYYLWVLYFDQIEHDRFGTIRQQIWALLHYPLHVAILLVVEGSTQFIIWNEIVLHLNWTVENLYSPYYLLPNETALQYATDFAMNLTTFDLQFKKKELLNSYNYTAASLNLSRLDMNTTEGFNRGDDIFNEMWYALAVFVFDNYNVAVPESSVPKNGTLNDTQRVNALSHIFWTVFLYFIIAAGCLLIILGILYWFGKTNKSKWEYASIAVRVLVGIGLSLASISYLFTTSWNLFFSPWMIPMVTIVYFIVIVIDNLLVWHSNKTIAHAIEYTRSHSEDRLNRAEDRHDHSQASSA